MQACNGVWVAHGTGSTERIVLDGRAGLKVPPAISGFRLRNVSLSTHEEQGTTTASPTRGCGRCATERP